VECIRAFSTGEFLQRHLSAVPTNHVVGEESDIDAVACFMIV
jgi:hypothetical protein